MTLSTVLALGGGSLERDWGDGKVSQGLHWTPAHARSQVWRDICDPSLGEVETGEPLGLTGKPA